MHSTTINAAVLALAAGVAAKTIKVEVGKGGLMFSPDTITAAKGDVVEFHFDSMHSVVAGDFKKPCNPVSSGGFFSGFLPKGSDSSFSVMIDNTDPMFLYCSVEDHCQEGMVAVINEGSDKLSTYKSAAAKAEMNVSPKSAFGGLDSTSATTKATTSMPSTTSGATAATTTATDTKAMTTAAATTRSKTAATTTGDAAPATTSGAAGPGAAVAGFAVFMAGLLAV